MNATNKVTEILTLVRERYECDEYVARSILGTRIGISQSIVKVMQNQKSFSPRITETLEEAEQFFTEATNETLCCPYIPAEDSAVKELSSAIAYLGGKVAFYEKLWPARVSMEKLAKRFVVRDGELFLSGSGKPVKDYGAHVKLCPEEGSSRKLWKQRRSASTFVVKGDELYPSKSRIIELLTNEQHWFDQYKVDYRGREFSGLEQVNEGSPIKIVLPVRIQSAHKGLSEDIRVLSVTRPLDYAPMMASHAAWLYKLAVYVRPNKPLTELRPDHEIVFRLTRRFRDAGDKLQNRIDGIIASGKRRRKKS